MNSFSIRSRYLGAALLAALTVLVVACSRPDRSELAAPAFARRQVDAPYTDIVLPDVERELLEPGFVWYIDPSLPLDLDAIDELPDLAEATRERLGVQIEAELQAMLFGE